MVCRIFQPLPPVAFWLLRDFLFVESLVFGFGYNGIAALLLRLRIVRRIACLFAATLVIVAFSVTLFVFATGGNGRFVVCCKPDVIRASLRALQQSVDLMRFGVGNNVFAHAVLCTLRSGIPVFGALMTLAVAHTWGNADEFCLHCRALFL